MPKFVVSLCGPLRGYGLRVEAKGEMNVRKWAKDTLGPTWCSVYGAEDPDIKDMVILGEEEKIWNYGEY